MHVLVTGAFGFIGSNLSKSFKGYSDVSLSAIDLTLPKKHSYNNFYTWDQLNNIDWNDIDSIIHLAGIAHDTKKTTNETSYFEINMGLTQKIYEYFLSSKASKFIYFSSVKAVADVVQGKRLKETDIPDPGTSYGRSKLAAEEFLLKQPLSSNKKLYILRPCMIHGPGNKGNLNLLYRFVHKGVPWPLGNFENKRSFTSIDNLVYAVNQVLRKDIEQGIYQIADDELISTNQLIQLIAESMSKKPRIWNVNKKVIYKIARLGDIFQLPINSERLQKLSQSYVVSNEKLKDALGIKKMPTPANEGFQKTMESFKSII